MTDNDNQPIEPTEIRQKIASYLRNLPPEILAVQKNPTVEILELSHGAYNMNYHVKVDEKDFLFRLNIEQQSGLADQIEYEFRAMRFLNPFGIVPKCYHLDNTKTDFGFGVLIEEYLHGPYISLVAEEMPEIAELLVRLHTLPPSDFPMIIWKDPLVDNYNQLVQDMAEYEAKKTPDKKIIQLVRKYMDKIEPELPKLRGLYKPDGINHTDTAIDNFIRTNKGLKLIDWEKPRLDDCTYDVCCFLCEPCQLWCTADVLSAEGYEKFMETYIRLSHRDPELFRQKVAIRIPIVAMHWILWSANRLCDVRDNLMASELQEIYEAKVIRWERVANLKNIEKLIETD